MIIWHKQTRPQNLFFTFAKVNLFAPPSNTHMSVFLYHQYGNKKVIYFE
jgi:hypothetical protein